MTDTRKKTTMEEQREHLQALGHPEPYRDLDAMEAAHVGHPAPTNFDRFHAGEWMRRSNDALHGLRPRPELPSDPNVRAWVRLYQQVQRDAGRRWWDLDDLYPHASIEQARGFVDALVQEWKDFRCDSGLEEADYEDLAEAREALT